MKRKLIAVAIVVAITCSVALAAPNANGTWNGEMRTREGGALQVALTLKADGDKVTGTIGIGNADEVAIENGKLSGDQLTFTVTRKGRDNQAVRINYTGNIQNDQIKLTRAQEGSARTQDVTLTRAK